MNDNCVVAILAAGRGSRLRPYTDTCPKALVELGGKALLRYQLDTLKAAGLDSVCLVTGYRREDFGIYGLRSFHNPDWQDTNMVYSLQYARELFDGTRDVVIAYSDIVYEARVVRSLLDSSAPLSVLSDRAWQNLWKLRMDDPLADAETFVKNADNTLVSLGERATCLSDIEGQFMGLIKVHRSYAHAFIKYLDQFRENKSFFARAFMTDFLRYLLAREQTIQAVETDGGWLEIDSCEDLHLFEGLLKSGEIAPICDLRR